MTQAGDDQADAAGRQVPGVDPSPNAYWCVDCWAGGVKRPARPGYSTCGQKRPVARGDQPREVGG